MITVTLEQIREQKPCKDGWATLLKSFETEPAPRTPFPLRHVLESNGLDGMLWCMMHLPEHYGLWRHFSIDCAERVSHLMVDPRSQNALKVARLQADGDATYQDLNDARKAALEAANDHVRGSREWRAAQAAEATLQLQFLDAVGYADEAEDTRAWQRQRLGMYLDLGRRPPDTSKILRYQVVFIDGQAAADALARTVGGSWRNGTIDIPIDQADYFEKMLETDHNVLSYQL